MVTNIFQNIFYVLQKVENHTDLTTVRVNEDILKVNYFLKC